MAYLYGLVIDNLLSGSLRIPVTLDEKFSTAATHN
jgi:hypothetical protein